MKEDNFLQIIQLQFVEELNKCIQNFNIFCPICTENYNDSDKKPIMICSQSNHTLCANCLYLKKQYYKSNPCPICRSKIREESEWSRDQKQFEMVTVISKAIIKMRILVLEISERAYDKYQKKVNQIVQEKQMIFSSLEEKCRNKDFRILQLQKDIKMFQQENKSLVQRYQLNQKFLKQQKLRIDQKINKNNELIELKDFELKRQNQRIQQLQEQKSAYLKVLRQKVEQTQLSRLTKRIKTENICKEQKQNEYQNNIYKFEKKFKLINFHIRRQDTFENNFIFKNQAWMLRDRISSRPRQPNERTIFHNKIYSKNSYKYQHIIFSFYSRSSEVSLYKIGLTNQKREPLAAQILVNLKKQNQTISNQEKFSIFIDISQSKIIVIVGENQYKQKFKPSQIQQKYSIFITFIDPKTKITFE